jgi:hypothetical protein
VGETRGELLVLESLCSDKRGEDIEETRRKKRTKVTKEEEDKMEGATGA